MAGRRQREAEDGLEAVAVSVNLTGEMAAPGKFTITEEQKPCPICNHCVIINRGLQSNILHCGMGHCRVAGCLAQFCWDCGAIIDSARTPRSAASSAAAHAAQLGRGRCERRPWGDSHVRRLRRHQQA